MTKNSFKLIGVTTVLITLIIGLSFFIGSFYPNKWITEKIQTEFHKQEVKEVIYLGLIQPEFDYNDNLTIWKELKPSTIGKIYYGDENKLHRTKLSKGEKIRLKKLNISL